MKTGLKLLSLLQLLRDQIIELEVLKDHMALALVKKKLLEKNRHLNSKILKMEPTEMVHHLLKRLNNMKFILIKLLVILEVSQRTSSFNSSSLILLKSRFQIIQLRF
jgi:hypothetical protein